VSKKKSKKTKFYRTGGGVVLDDAGRVLLLERHVPRKKTPGHEIRLPKGHIEADETPEQAALREVCEESGYCHLEILFDLGELENNYNFRGRHFVREERYFLMRLTDSRRQAPQPSSKNAEEALFQPIWAHSLDEAEALLTFESEKIFIRRARNALSQQSLHINHDADPSSDSTTP